ncbi:MAG TPA: type I secretion system permease/ATPase [Alcanivoracaceae bacterium]|nr:type I secretion system permease/ATPase [Alcanivoracaceae bacterium]
MSQDLARMQQWTAHLLLIANHYSLSVSPHSAALRSHHITPTNKDLSRFAQQLGLHLEFTALPTAEQINWRSPFIVEMHDHSLAIVEKADQENVWLRFADESHANSVSLQTFTEQVKRAAMARPIKGRKDKRVDDFMAPYKENWLKKIIFMDMRPYFHVMVAALIANVLGLAGILFSMQVYDRVVPGQSMPTLYVLFTGVVVATLITLMMRILRGNVTNILGKRADLRISDAVFGHSLHIKPTAKPASTGTFIAQLRELEQLRELITSSTVGAATDMPFFVLFLGVFTIIAGPLVWVPVVAVVIMLLPSLVMQKKLGVLAREATRESSLRNALLVETIQGLEDVKSLQAEPQFLQQWNEYTHSTASASLALRNLTNALLSWSQVVQMGVFAVVVFFGAPMVIDGDLTTGALVAASILSSRMLAPMGQISQVLTRWQHAKVAIEAADSLMQLPTEGQGEEELFHRPHLQGHYELKQSVFSYGEEQDPVLQIPQLTIKAGERVALLGRNGAGKSSLLNALAGNMLLNKGAIHLDGTQLSQIDPADIRRDVVLLSQHARLFHGTLRYNLTLGNPGASDEALEEALILSGAMPFVQQLSDGLDHLILEGGLGLSGGQRQAFLLARLMLRNPNVVLLDEPTAALDDSAEQAFLTALKGWLGEDKTLVVATHRLGVLSLIDRVLVLNQGRVVLDAPKDEALKKLTGK